MPAFKSALAALVAALAVSATAAAAEGSSRKTLELTAEAATAMEMALGFDSEGARRRALQGEYPSGNVIEVIERGGGGGGSF